ncbi:MAG: exonuclease domain-containing protein, partial [Ruminococcus sp.]|nr:exonuclease domain-containing protein [Ruminococcus sp.]
MLTTNLIKDEVYNKCWGNIKSTVRTNIKVPKEVLQTDKQWAKLGYVVDRPTENHARGAYLWTNANCGKKCLYYFSDEVRKGTEDELNAFFAPERERKKAATRKCRARKKAEKEKFKKVIEILDRFQIKTGKIDKSNFDVTNICKNIIQKTESADINAVSVVVIDTESTGLNPITDELLKVSIISETKEVLYDSYLKPLFAENWEGAEKVNGITPEMVKDSPTVLSECAKINSIVSQADFIIGYLPEFDLEFLANIGCKIKDNAEIIDVAEIFAKIYGEWSEYYQSYKFQKLTTCASYYG